MQCHIFLAFMISGESSVVILIVFSLQVRCHFSMAAFKVFHLSLVFRSLIKMCLSMQFFGLILLGLLSFLNLQVYAFIFAKFGMVSAITFLSTCLTLTSFSSTFRTPMIQMLDLLLQSQHVSEALLTVFFFVVVVVQFSFSLFFRLGNFCCSFSSSLFFSSAFHFATEHIN